MAWRIALQPPPLSIEDAEFVPKPGHRGQPLLPLLTGMRATDVGYWGNFSRNGWKEPYQNALNDVC